MARIILDIPDNLYKSLEKYALIRGSNIENIILDLIRIELSFIGEVDSYYAYRLGQVDRAVEELMKAINNGEVRIKIRERDRLLDKYIKPLGRFLAVIKEVYGRIPEKIHVKELLDNPVLDEAVKKHVGGQIEDPRKTIMNYIVKRIKRVAPAFKIRVEGEGLDTVIVFENPANLEGFAGIGSRIMRRRVRR